MACKNEQFKQVFILQNNFFAQKSYSIRWSTKIIDQKKFKDGQWLKQNLVKKKFCEKSLLSKMSPKKIVIKKILSNKICGQQKFQRKKFS